MTNNFRLLALFAATAAIGHVGTVMATPHVLMRVAMNRLSGGGQAINQFQFAERTTQESRRIVRPSPDLAYASCVYDLSQGPLLVSAAPSPDQGYVSLSVFADNTDNIAALDTTRYPQGIRFVLALEGQQVPDGAQVVRSPSHQGIVLDRRLAPTAQAFAEADKARRANGCAGLTR